jgi:RNA polymerase sigma factor (sigma-70 family)
VAVEAAGSLESAMTGGPVQELVEPQELRFESLYLAHYSRVVGLLFRLTASRSEAEELANEVFWKLYRQPLKTGPDASVSGWLYRTATNAGIDALRKAARRREYEERAARAGVESHPAAGPLEGVLREEKRRRVRRVLGQLKPVQAQALVLRSSGFSYEEVAAVLRVKRVSVGTLLLRSEQAFRKCYWKLYGKEEV